jgi:hypothetical protein
LALLYRVKKYPVLEFSFSYEKGVGFKIFLQGLDPVGFFYLTGLKSSIGLLDILVFQLLVLVTAFWILVLFGFSWLAFLSVCRILEILVFAIIAFYSIGFGFWFWFFLGY